MHFLQLFAYTPTGVIGAYLALGILVLGAGWVADAVLAGRNKN